MTLTAFSLLSTTDQLAIIYADGVYLAKRFDGFHHVVLYQYQQLYVEINYLRYRRTINFIRYSEDTEILDPFFESMPIEEIFAGDS
jgi:hypothetical protein